MSVATDPHLRRGAGSVLLAVGTAGVIFALTAPGGGSEASRTLDLGPGVRALDVQLVSARLRVSAAAGDHATLRAEGRVAHDVSGGTARLRCEGDCDGVTVDVRVPRATSVRASVGAGSAAVTGIRGRIELRSTTAKLSALDVRPPAISAVTERGDTHISLDAVPRTVDARSASSPISVSVPYAYDTDGYRLDLRTSGHQDLDITRSSEAGAPVIRARSETGDLLITQRYPNMS